MTTSIHHPLRLRRGTTRTAGTASQRRHAWRLAAVLALATAVPLTSLAALQARDANLDSVVDGYFDNVLNLTWVRNAQLASGSPQDDGSNNSDGLLTWASAQTWVAGLTVAGVGGWRLPSIDTACNGSGTGYGCNAPAGELGYMFYVNLGGLATLPISTLPQNANHALFSGIADVGYWSGQTLASDPDQAGVQLYNEGYQDFAFKSLSENAAWAVQTGDVLAVPEPASVALLLSGLLLIAHRRLHRHGSR